MLSKNLLKLIRSLEVKKYRKESALFVAEGEKLVKDLLASDVECLKVIATEEFSLHSYKTKCPEFITVSDEELKKASFLRTPQGILGIFKQKSIEFDPTLPERELCLALDDVQDPGNLGTIIRIADWFGIENIFCSIGTVDIYNPKTVQATMGAKSQNKSVPVYGTFLDGKNIYEHPLSVNGIVIMGNEGNGIGNECEKCISERILIPNFPIGRPTSESLNVSTATAIVCSEFRRRVK